MPAPVEYPNQSNSQVTLQDIGNHTFLLTLHFNVFNFESIKGVSDILDFLDTIKGPIALITTNSHKKIYSAGMDLKVFQSNNLPLIKDLLK